MLANVGTFDRILRMLAGATVTAAGLYFQSWWGGIGVVLLLTGASARCLAYLPFKISTR